MDLQNFYSIHLSKRSKTFQSLDGTTKRPNFSNYLSLDKLFFLNNNVSFFSSLNVSELVNKWQQKAESLNLTELLDEQCAMGKEYSTRPNSTKMNNRNNSFWYV
jgi:hypothetical protein